MAIPEKYSDAVNHAAGWAAGIGIPGSVLPPLDMTAMAIIWIRMTREIARISGHSVNFIFATKLIYSVLSGSILYLGGSKLINALLHVIPGAGTVTAAGANSIFNYIYTKRLGSMLVTQFDQPEINKGSLLAMAGSMAAGVFASVSADDVATAHDILNGAGVTEAAAAGAAVALDPVHHSAALSDYAAHAASVDVSAAAELAQHSSNAVQHGHLGDIRFTGFEHVEHLADSQQGPTCVSEMAENIMQLDDPSLSNDASTWIQQITGTQGQRMDPGWIVPMLEQRGIPAGWFDFNHGQIASALQANQAVGIVGHSHFLTSSFVHYDQYPPDLHCVTLTDVIKDGYGNITHYKGIDSNAQGREVIWPAQAIEGAVRNAGDWANKALITLRPLRWPWTTS